MSWPEWVRDAHDVLDITAGIVAVGSIMSSAELVAVRAEFQRHGLFDPRVQRVTRRWSVRRLAATLSVPLLSSVQLVTAVAVIVCLALDVSPAAPLVVLAITAVLRTVRIPYGLEGSDSMSIIVTVALAVASVLEDHRVVVRIALLFIAAQLCLAYVASGVAKLFGRAWRSGDALRAILHTEFGHPGLVRATLDRWQTFGRFLTWSVIAIEISFPFGIVLGSWPAVVALAMIAALQVSIAFAMGLNRFLPWFLAAFPATAWATAHFGVLS